MRPPISQSDQDNQQQKRPQYKFRGNRIENYLQDWKVFVDTCAFMTEGSVAFFSKAISLFAARNQKFICPVRCIQEVQKHLHAKDQERRQKAQRAFSIIQEMRNTGVIDIRGEESDNFADNVFQRVFIQHRIKHNLLLITQDRGLATDLMSMNNSHAATRAHPIHVLRIKSDGSLGLLMHKDFDYESGHWLTPPNRFQQDRQEKPRRTPQVQKQPQSAPPRTCRNAENSQTGYLVHGEDMSSTFYQPSPRNPSPSRYQPNTQNSGSQRNQGGQVRRTQSAKAQSHGSQRPSAQPPFRFSLPSTVITVEDRQNPVTDIPGEGAFVHDETGATYQLATTLGSGGEGIVYDTRTPYVAKIYRREKNTVLKAEKIHRLTQHPLNCTGICAPVRMLFTMQNEFVGYLMPRAQGHDLLRCLMVRPLLEKRFAGWKKADLVQLCITILEKIQFLHDRNIILGDINLSNIKVVSPTEVYLVDCDSYQVEDLPCPVGQVNFTAPEIQGRRFNEFLRTKGNEYFAVSTMLFMILVPGKTPYAHQGGSEGFQNISEGFFAYPYQDRSTGKVPPGVWGYIWSHMTYEIKKSFGHTFDKAGDYYDESKRLTVADWLSKLRHYHRLLTSGILLKQDEMSNDIFPTRLKKNVESKMLVCRLCGSEFDEKSGKEGICNTCLNYRGTVYNCQSCGCEMAITNYELYVLKKKPFTWCPTCYQNRQTRNDIEYSATCVCCGGPIQMTKGECDFYRSKGLSFPKRCKACRDNPQRAQVRQVRTYSQYPSQSNSQSPSFIGGFFSQFIKGIFGIK